MFQGAVPLQDHVLLPHPHVFIITVTSTQTEVTIFQGTVLRQQNLQFLTN